MLFHVNHYLFFTLITVLKYVICSNTVFCSSQVLCSSTSWFTLYDDITAGTIGLPIPVEHLTLPFGTCEDLLDPVAQKLVSTLILQHRHHAAHSRGVSPQKGSIRASSPGGGLASTYSPNTGLGPWGQTRGPQALWPGGAATSKGLPALHFLPVGGIFYLHRIPHWCPTEACPVGREKGARRAPVDSQAPPPGGFLRQGGIGGRCAVWASSNPKCWDGVSDGPWWAWFCILLHTDGAQRLWGGTVTQVSTPLPKPQPLPTPNSAQSRQAHSWCICSTLT